MRWLFHRRSPEQKLEDYYKRIACENAARALEAACAGELSFGLELASQKGLPLGAPLARQEDQVLSAEMQEWAARLPGTCYRFQATAGLFFFRVERVNEHGQVVCSC